MLANQPSNHDVVLGGQTASQFNATAIAQRQELAPKLGLSAELADKFIRHNDLSYVNLSEAKLSGANLSGAKLFAARLSKADLSGANLSCCDLSKHISNKIKELC